MLTEWQSEPFGFRHVTTNIKGLSEDEYVTNLIASHAVKHHLPRCVCQAATRSQTSQTHIEKKLTATCRLQVLREKAIASRFSTIDAQLAQQQHELHQKPSRPNKTRPGYRGLTSSPLSASRPSITQSFAAEDSASQLSHTTASSTSGGSDHGCDMGKETLL